MNWQHATLCRPARPRDECLDCARHCRVTPHEPERRPGTLLLDVLAVIPNSHHCPLWRAKPERTVVA